MTKQRIQKVLAEAGLASRRAVEEMILEGRIVVNGRPVAELPCFVDPGADEVRVDGRRFRLGRAARRVYYLLNKPRGVVCTQSDPQNRARAVDLLGEAHARVYCVGRLDVETTGLIVLTNDGELTQKLTHPSGEVIKTYVVQIDGRISGEEMDQLKAGVYLDGKRTRGVRVKVLRRSPTQSLLEIKLGEGRNREIRRVLARLGHRVRRLKRTAIGQVTDHGLKIGNWRVLSAKEVRQLTLAPLVPEERTQAPEPAASPGKGKRPAASPPKRSTEKTPSRQASAKKAPSRKTSAKKAPSRKTSAKKAPSRKVSAKKAPSRKDSGKRTPLRKGSAKKAPSRKGSAERTPSRKGSAERTPSRKGSAPKRSRPTTSSRKGPPKKPSRRRPAR